MLIFISYSSLDSDFALRVRDQLQNWGHETWLMADSIPAGSYWPDEIDKGLQASDVVLNVIFREDDARVRVRFSLFLI